MRSKTKALLIVACVLMLALASVMGTLAWLTDKEEISNIFTVGKVEITLAEGDNIANNLKMVPGFTIEKAPKVTVENGSEDCYVFVEIVTSDNFETYLSYEMNDGWNNLITQANKLVYYRIVEDPTGTAINILKDDQVTVKGSVTSAQMAEADTSKVTMSFTAYAIQLNKTNNTQFDVLEAWSIVSSSTN